MGKRVVRADSVEIGQWVIVGDRPAYCVEAISTNSLGDIILRCSFSGPGAYPGVSLLLDQCETVTIEKDSRNTSETFQTWQEREAFALGFREASVEEWTNAREAEFEQRYAELLDSAPDAAAEAAIAWAYDRGAEAGYAQRAAQEIAEAHEGVADPWGAGVAGFELPEAR